MKGEILAHFLWPCQVVAGSCPVSPAGSHGAPFHASAVHPHLIILRQPARRDRGVYPSRHPTGSPQMFSKKTETSNFITNIRVSWIPGEGHTGVHRNLICRYQHANKGEVSALPTVVVFAFLESLLCTSLCLSLSIILVSQIHSELQRVSELLEFSEHH